MNQKSNQLSTQLVTNQSKRPITELIGAIPDPTPQGSEKITQKLENEKEDDNKIELIIF